MSSDREALTHTVASEAAAPGMRPAALDRATLGRYRLDRVLGIGGMGVVHAAFDLDLERKVAIKVLHHDPAHVSRTRLLREARAMARLDHPNVVKIFEVDSIDGIDFVVMELVAGGSLAEWLRSEPRPAREIRDAFVAAGLGLAAAHAAGMVHRDFKPQNVLRTKAGAIKVGDFGLAREADDTTANDTVTADRSATAIPASKLANVTQTGTMVGTPAYMAPEQWSADAISPAVDQFAFCVAMWEALTGERPFRGDTSAALRAAIDAGPSAPDLAKLPRRYRALLLRGLAVDPARRWPSLQALVAELQRSAVWRRLGVAAAIATVAAIAIAVAALSGGHPQRAQAVADPHVFVPKAQRELVATVETLGDDHVRMPRATVDQVLLERTELTDAIKAVASTAGDRMVGFKLFAIRPSSLAAKLGFRDGDRVTGLDELDFASEASVLAAYHRALAAPTLAIHYVRANRAHTLVVEVTP